MERIKEEELLDLTKVEEIGKTTAECLRSIGIKNPDDLANADAQAIADAFSKGERSRGFYNANVNYVNKWILSAKSGNWKYSKAEERLAGIKQRAKENQIDYDIDQEAFRKFFGEDAKNRKCAYCGISEADIKKLLGENKILRKNIDIRGKFMEIDRKDPKKGYIHRGEDDTNIVICCYWCNNAKIDEFDADEFKPIGDAIREAWKVRLGI